MSETDNALIQHLFRTEFGKISAVLTRSFGFNNVDLAHDIASETFLLALETWPFNGLPENPTAWLYTVAKNKARNNLRREQRLDDILSVAKTEHEITNAPELDLSEKNIADSQLQMLFAICNPVISPESQIALALRVLCGFGIDEIANAFLTTKDVINKRLLRAKEKLRKEKVEIVFPEPAVIGSRLSSVLTTLYLLFNEGYYSESDEAIVREELCAEAMRLNLLLIRNTDTDTPQVNALYALMCFHSSRLGARKTENGDAVLYNDQDESRWDHTLISSGTYYLNKASQGPALSKYHIEAAIAFWHTCKVDTPEKWENILQLYNKLLQLEYSPVAALNRTFALSKANGKQEAIVEAEKLQLKGNRFYFLLLGDLYKGLDDDRARHNLTVALSLVKSNFDKSTIQRQLAELSPPVQLFNG